jgi:hypothetical protein
MVCPTAIVSVTASRRSDGGYAVSAEAFPFASSRK